MTPQQAAGYQTQILLPMLTPQGAGNLTLEKIKIMGGARQVMMSPAARGTSLL
jgi:hypothetical protein